MNRARGQQTRLVSAVLITGLLAVLPLCSRAASADVPHVLGGLSVSVTTNTAGAPGATYAVSFVATSGIAPGNPPELNIVTAPGTGTPAAASYTDSTNPSFSASSVCISAGATSNAWVVGCGSFHANAGDSVTLTFTSVTNPETPNPAYPLSVTTNSDAVTTTSYAIVSATPPTPSPPPPPPASQGYSEVASDGGVFSFNSTFYGSEGGKTLNAPIVGIASTPDGKGYWLVASDGGVFTFGDASFYGAEGGKTLNAPIVGIAP